MKYWKIVWNSPLHCRFDFHTLSLYQMFPCSTDAKRESLDYQDFPFFIERITGIEPSVHSKNLVKSRRKARCLPCVYNLSTTLIQFKYPSICLEGDLSFQQNETSTLFSVNYISQNKKYSSRIYFIFPAILLREAVNFFSSSSSLRTFSHCIKIIIIKPFSTGKYSKHSSSLNS